MELSADALMCQMLQGNKLLAFGPVLLCDQQQGLDESIDYCE
jgi:hypothetical protein